MFIYRYATQLFDCLTVQMATRSNRSAWHAAINRDSINIWRRTFILWFQTYSSTDTEHASWRYVNSAAKTDGGAVMSSHVGIRVRSRSCTLDRSLRNGADLANPTKVRDARMSQLVTQHLHSESAHHFLFTQINHHTT